MYKTVIHFVFFIACLMLSIGCDNLPYPGDIEYKNPGPAIKLGDVSGDLYYGYVKRTGSITFNFSQDRTGYYSVRVYDSSMVYISGTGSNAWVSYNTENTIIPITIYSPNSSSGQDTYFNNSGIFHVVVSARDINNFESSESMDFTVAPLNAILVDGAGSTAANGWYLRITSFTFLRPSTQYTVNYQKSGSTNFYISADDTMPGSHIHSGTSSDYVEYYYSSSTSVPPAFTGWNKSSTALNPVPTFYLNN